MRNIILLTVASTVLSYSAVASAGDRPFADFKNVIGNETYSGKENKDTTCTLKSEWLQNGNLEVTTISKYKMNKPSVAKTIFSVEKGVEYSIEHYNDDVSEYMVSQSTDITTDKNDPLSLYESFTITQDASGVTGMSVSVMEVNEHSDPSEVVTFHCSK